jgi:DUF1680 family protein
VTDRRSFLKAASASVAALAARRVAAQTNRRLDRAFEHGQALREFGYGSVSIQSSLHTQQLGNAHTVLMGLSEDSLLRPFRKAAGLAAPGCDLGGWYSAREFEAETFGQWISALSRYYAITADEPTRAKAQRLVASLAATVEPGGKLYANRPPAYLYDKLVCGVIDASYFVKEPSALVVLSRITDAAVPYLPGRPSELVKDSGGETYTIPENQFVAWQRGGSPRHLEMARQYLFDEFFVPLAQGQNVLGGRHAYSHVNALCSAAKAYLVVGDETYLRAARNGFAFIEAQSFATGGWGPNEYLIPAPEPFGGGAPQGWMPPIATLGDSLEATHWHFETCCGAYAHFKLTRYLLRITRESIYGDSMERVMYNTILGAKTLREDGRAFYQSDYNGDGRKVYFNGYGGLLPSEWPCCSGTLPQIAADYHISTYFADQEDVYVNLFIPSTLTWRVRGTHVSLTQSGSYPLQSLVSMKVDTPVPAAFTLHMRIPAWVTKASIAINGKQVPLAIKAGAFFTLKREWRNGDLIELDLPGKIQLKPVDDSHAQTVAVSCGPLVLFALCTRTPKVTREQLMRARQVQPGSTDWLVDTQQGPLQLVPFWRINEERYSTYLSLVET